MALSPGLQSERTTGSFSIKENIYPMYVHACTECLIIQCMCTECLIYTMYVYWMPYIYNVCVLNALYIQCMCTECLIYTNFYNVCVLNASIYTMYVYWMPYTCIYNVCVRNALYIQCMCTEHAECLLYTIYMYVYWMPLWPFFDIVQYYGTKICKLE